VVSKTRTVRIAERMRNELSEMLIKEIHDPRLHGVSITGIEVDRELAYATIYYSSIEGAARVEEIQAGLEHAQGFLRSELAQRIELRVFPRLRFRYDPTFERAENIERIFAELNAETKPKVKRE
jgi:ribosome-binding factor A